MTVNDCPANRTLFKGHEIRPVVTRSGAVNRRMRPEATFGEIIVRRRLAARVGAGKASAVALAA